MFKWLVVKELKLKKKNFSLTFSGLLPVFFFFFSKKKKSSSSFHVVSKSPNSLRVLGGVLILTLARQSASSLVLTSHVVFAHWVCDVYLLAISVTSPDRSLHYHPVSSNSSQTLRHLLWSWLGMLLNGFSVFVNYVFAVAYRLTEEPLCVCSPALQRLHLHKFLGKPFFQG